MLLKKTIFLVVTLIVLFSCTKKMKTIDEISYRINDFHRKMRNASKDSMKLYLLKTKKLFAKNLEFTDSLIAENHFLKGRYFDKKSDLDSTIYYYNQAITLDTDSIVSEKEFEYYKSIILKYYYAENYINALSYSNGLIKKINHKNEFKKLGLIYNFKTMIHIKLKKYELALNDNSKSIQYYKQTNDSSYLNTIINNRSRIFYGLNKKDSAKFILNNLLQKKNTLSFSNKYQSYTRLGIYNFFDNDFNTAKTSYLNALINAKKINATNKIDQLANCYNNIAEVYLKLKKFNIAKKYLDSTFLLGIDNLRAFRIRNAQKYKLQLLYATKQDITPVINYLDTVLKVNEQNYIKKMDHEFLALTKSYKNEQNSLKQKQLSALNNAKLKRKQLVLFTILIALFFSSIIGILYYRKQKIKYERDKIMLQQRLFSAQMNPHFTSNILYSIQNLFRINIDIADDYLVKFSRLLRLNLENSVRNYVPIEKEIEAVEKYLALQKLRYPNVFEYEILGDCLDELLFIPPMLIQPFVENAIEHGFKNINYLGILKIQLDLKENVILCDIIDNGKGINTDNGKERTKESTSTTLIKKRLKKLTGKSVLMINNKKMFNGKGAQIKFFIPFKTA